MENNACDMCSLLIIYVSRAYMPAVLGQRTKALIVPDSLGRNSKYNYSNLLVQVYELQ